MALDQGRESIPLFAAQLEIPSRTRKTFSPNNLLQPPMLDLINSGGQRPGKCFSFQLSSFWLCLFSFLDSRSLKMHFLKHPSLLHRTGTISPTKGRQKWFPLDSFGLKGFLFLSFSVFRRWRQFWFLWRWKHLGQTTIWGGKWNNEDNDNGQETCLGQDHCGSIYLSSSPPSAPHLSDNTPSVLSKAGWFHPFRSPCSSYEESKTVKWWRG